MRRRKFEFVRSASDPLCHLPVYEPQEPEIDSEVAATWLRIAGAKMYACREIMGPKRNPDWEKKRGCLGGSGGIWDGVDGYHLDRWKHWKGILQEGVAKGSWRRNVIEAAHAALDVMEKVEHETHSQWHRIYIVRP